MYIHSPAKHRRSGSTMQKCKPRGAVSSFYGAREVLPGYPKHFKFGSDAEVAEYLAGDTVRCLLCGKHYKHLPPHIARVHGMAADAYKEAYNIRSCVALMGAPTKALHRDAAIASGFNHAQPSLTAVAERKKPTRRVFTTYTRAESSAHLRAIAPKGGHASAIGPLTRSEFLKLIEGGHTATSSCRALGIGRTSYKRWIAAADFLKLYEEAKDRGGAADRKPPGRTRTFDYDAVLGLQSEGLTCAEISRRTGIGYHAVYRACHPLPPRSRL